MAQKYKPKSKTGNEYVQSAIKFKRYVDHFLSKLPKDFLSDNELSRKRILEDMTDSSSIIKNESVRANAVPIESSKNPEFVNSLRERDKHLKIALQEFDVFESSLDDLIGNIDLMKAERARLGSILYGILRENGYHPKSNLNDKNENENSNDSNDPYKIIVHQRPSEIEYESIGGKQSLKLGITSSNKDYLIKLETDARNGISERLTKDREMIKKIVSTNKAIESER